MHSYRIAFPILLDESLFLIMSPTIVYICSLAFLSPLPSNARIFNNLILHVKQQKMSLQVGNHFLSKSRTEIANGTVEISTNR